MTTTTSPRRTPSHRFEGRPPDSDRIRALRESALLLTALACLPYLGLKLAWVASLIALFPLAVHLMWAFGVDWPAGVASESGTSAVVYGVNAFLIVVAVWGSVMLMFGSSLRMSVRVPLLAAWIGSAAMGAWGAWMLFGAAMTHDGSPLAVCTVFAAAAVAGAMLLVTGTHLFVERAAVDPDPPLPTGSAPSYSHRGIG